MENTQVPAGFGAALMGNEQAVNAFAMMTPEQKQEILQKAATVKTKGQMQSLVNCIAKDAR